jgi:hypothetical protein|tara:strand:+ start:1437 stop:1625 length:189 start_codon:yes stop_codon:yes gene_type:complete
MTTLEEHITDKIAEHLESQFDHEWSELTETIAEQHGLDRDRVEQMFFAFLQQILGDKVNGSI